jgi:hypothetical protein
MVSYTYSGITSEDSYSNEPHSGIVLVEGIEIIKSDVPAALTLSNSWILYLWFCMILSVNSDYFLEQR